MMLHTTHCCGIKEISSLSSHATARAAMFAFCAAEMSNGTSYYKDGNGQHIPYTYFMFTAAVYDKECSTFEQYSANNPSGVRNGKYNPYGDEFAQLITDNKLGEVVTTGAHVNKACHPDHKVQAWIWRIDADAVREWWATNAPFSTYETLKTKLAKAEQNFKLYGNDYYDGAFYKKNYETAQIAFDKEVLAVKAYLEKLKLEGKPIPEDAPTFDTDAPASDKKVKKKAEPAMVVEVANPAAFVNVNDWIYIGPANKIETVKKKRVYKRKPKPVVLLKEEVINAAAEADAAQADWVTAYVDDTNDDLFAED